MAVDYYGHKVNKSNIWHNLGHQITSKNHDTPKILYEMAEHDPLYDVITWWPDMTWQIFFLQKMHKVSLSNFYYGYDYLRCLVSTQSADLCRSEHENRVFPIDLHVCLSSSMADALEGGDFVTSSKRVYWHVVWTFLGGCNLLGMLTPKTKIASNFGNFVLQLFPLFLCHNFNH